MIISLIVAIANNNAIGKNNDLLWHLPADMKFFKETTSGHHIITGRKNYISIPERFRPLPNRENIIVTRNPDLKFDGCQVFDSIEKAIAYSRQEGQDEVFIIGGGQIYNQSLELVDRMYITHVDTVVEDADTFFPEFNQSDWKVSKEWKTDANDKNKFPMIFRIYNRKVI